MEQTETPGADAAPGNELELRELDFSDLRESLTAGWNDFRNLPRCGLTFASIYVLGGWLVLLALTVKGQLWWTLPAAAGFPILGPFIASGLYEASRRLETGERLSMRSVWRTVFLQKDRQIPSIAAVVVIFFLFWNFLAHMIFALFLGNATMTNVSSSLAVFGTQQGITMLVVGTAVGAVFAILLFAITVISLPLLLDREVDFVTAMITSFSLVRDQPVVMLTWGVVIAGLTFVAMLPAFLGLLVVLPVLGHASWHLYRRAVV